MTAFTMPFIVIYVATVAAAITGWVLPPTFRFFQWREGVVVVASFALAFTQTRDPFVAIGLGTLFPGVYFSFGHWRRAPGSPKKAFWAAFFGVMFFVQMTTNDWQPLVIAATVGLAGPRAACWVTERTHRVVGLALIVAATVFQLTRVPYLLAS